MNGECLETSSAIYLVIDGEASTVVRWRVTRHVQMCSECRRRYEFERQLKALIERAWRCAGCPDGFEDRLKNLLLSEFE